MGVLSLFNFGTASFFSLLMRNGHLTFSVGAGMVILNFLIVLVLTIVAAYLPAARPPASTRRSRSEPANNTVKETME
jgi:hypothetical protein